MPYLNLHNDVLVFSDSARLAAGVVDDAGFPKARCVTSGLARLLEDLFFDPTRAATPSLEEIRCYGTEQSAGPDHPAVPLDVEGLERFVATQRGFELGTSEQPLGTIGTEVFEDDGLLVLDGEPVWRPAGIVAQRAAGGRTMSYVVTPCDLRGAIREDLRLEAVAMIRHGSKLTITDATCNTCPICATCALCAICGEINADVAAAGATGVFSLAPQSAAEQYPPSELQHLVESSVHRHLATAYLKDRIHRPVPA